jgi:hypothetical protein
MSGEQRQFDSKTLKLHAAAQWQLIQILNSGASVSRSSMRLVLRMPADHAMLDAFSMG